MNFSEMVYERPDLEDLKQQTAALTGQLKEAPSYAAARETFLQMDQLQKHISTLSSLASIRHSIDTRDEYYDGEAKFWNAALPELQEYQQEWTLAMLHSPYRKEFETEYGNLMFLNAEIDLKTFSPEIIPQLQRENDLVQEYEKLLASAQIPFAAQNRAGRAESSDSIAEVCGGYYAKSESVFVGESESVSESSGLSGERPADENTGTENRETDKINADNIEEENGGVKLYTLSQMAPFKNDPDDAVRLRAWKAEGQWYKDHQEKLDELYDELVHLRDEMGRKLGYDGYTELGYYRMGRNCYSKEDVEKFRGAVQKYLVPVADEIYREQAKRLGKEYPMSFADNALEFRSGNPRPCGTPDEILAQGKKFYDELSPETSAFFNKMLDDGLMDVLSTEGKEGGGYCTSIPDYGIPFIFANFNGTQHDVEVVTHEAGHAFAYYMNRNRVPMSTCWPGMEACEVHSMSMEFLSWPWAEGFFGKDTRKFRYSHLAGALTFIPYGTMVDHFQHIVFEKPDMPPAERHGVWKELLGIYMPWMKLDGEIPFYSEGEGWQRQHHIYSFPFYYIDYCLAQTVSLEFWAMMQKEMRENAIAESSANKIKSNETELNLNIAKNELIQTNADDGNSGAKIPNTWARYMAYTKQGGSCTFTELLKNAGLESPFDEACLRGVCAEAKQWLENYDLSGIE
ncbi:MAG: M3 family oligoendopeptidase [Lachnospiraceae bacterium]|nr:M3 family oligoendopeptidase [Lachnospiraceae bacterium]